MTKTGQGDVKREPAATDVPSLDALLKAAGAGRGKPPVHLWNPAFCGAIDMRIAADGTWFYQGTPIGRPALVKLFASVLKYEADERRHVLVTPVEKVEIAVDDAPFLAVEMRRGEGRVLRIAFRTNVDDWVVAGPDNPLTFERGDSGGVKPYVAVRHGLRALVTRALMYDLVAMGEVRKVDGVESLSVESDGVFFVIAPVSEMESAP